MPISNSISKLFEPVIARIEQYKQRLSTADGASDRSWELDGGYFGRKENKQVVFTLPPGFQRFTFGYEITKGVINAGGNVKWANNDPNDATILVHL